MFAKVELNVDGTSSLMEMGDTKDKKLASVELELTAQELGCLEIHVCRLLSKCSFNEGMNK